MQRGWWFAAILGLVPCFLPAATAIAQLQDTADQETPSLEETPATSGGAADSDSTPLPKPEEKLARIWANEPPLVRLARDKFGDEFTETDAKFFAAVAAHEWADFRPEGAKYDATDPTSWKESTELKADRLIWLCSEPEASALVSNRGITLRGARITQQLNLYRCTLPFTLTLIDCLLDGGLNIRSAKLQELYLTNCCSAKIEARGVQVVENVYLLRTVVFGGLNFIEAQIAGDLDMDGGLAFHGMSSDDVAKPGVAIDLYDANIGGDVKLGSKFRAYGRVRLNGTQIGRSLVCSGGEFNGNGQSAIDADRAQVAQNVSLGGEFTADGCVDLRRMHIGGDLDCDGGQFDGGEYSAIIGDLSDIGGQVYLGDGLNAKGEVRLVSSVIGKDVDCDNGHFLNPSGNALSFDSTVIGRSLRVGHDTTSPTDKDTSLPPGFLARGTVRLYGTHINQDLLGNCGQFEAPEAQAIVACNLRVASRAVLTGVEVKGQVDLSAADIEHELDMRGSHFDGSQVPNHIAIWARGMKVRGHVYCTQIDAPEKTYEFQVDGTMSFQFVNIDMSWDLYGAKLRNAEGDALDASDCHVGGYVNLDQVAIDGRATFSRAKIDGMWVLTHVVHPERMTLDMRFAHVWVIKDERLDDWPVAGNLQLEGFVYDHFDDDSPLGVEDRLAWLRRQYAVDSPRPMQGAAEADSEPQAGETAHNSSSTPSGRRSQVETRSANTQLAQHLVANSQRGVITPVAFESAPGMAAPSVGAQTEPSRTEEPASPLESDDNQDPSDAATESEASVAAATQDDSSTGGDENANQFAEKSKESATESAPAQLAVSPDPAGRRYITQPYTQLASVYRAVGQDEQANAVLVARAERLGELSPALSAQGLWYRYLGRLIGYGYEPFRAIKIGIGIVIVGTIVFAIGARRHLMAETKLAERVITQEDESGLVTHTYPRFNAFVYSLDVFLPFVDLHQICYWIPGERNSKPRSRNCLMHIGRYKLKWSGLLRTYFWFQTLAGWTLCTLLAAAVTGIVES